MRFLSIGIIATGFLLSLSGCSSLPMLKQFVEKPTLAVDSFSMGEASFFKQSFKVKLKVDNPNTFALPILGLDYGLNIAGVDVAQGSNKKSFTIPAKGSDIFEIDVNTNLLKTLPDLRKVLITGGKDMSYKLTGNLKTKNLIVNSIPFEKSGVFEFAL